MMCASFCRSKSAQQGALGRLRFALAEFPRFVPFLAIRSSLKGRAWQGTEAKDAAIKRWCEPVTAASGSRWEYARVNQSELSRGKFATFADCPKVVPGTEAKGVKVREAKLVLTSFPRQGNPAILLRARSGVASRGKSRTFNADGNAKEDPEVPGSEGIEKNCGPSTINWWMNTAFINELCAHG